MNIVNTVAVISTPRPVRRQATEPLPDPAPEPVLVPVAAEPLLVTA